MKPNAVQRNKTAKPLAKMTKKWIKYKLPTSGLKEITRDPIDIKGIRREYYKLYAKKFDKANETDKLLEKQDKIENLCDHIFTKETKSAIKSLPTYTHTHTKIPPCLDGYQTLKNI